MPRRLAQQRMPLNDLEWSFPYRALSAVADILVIYSIVIRLDMQLFFFSLDLYYFLICLEIVLIFIARYVR